MALHLHNVTFDAADPAGLARFWAAVTGYHVGQSSPFFAELTGDGTVGPRYLFVKVPEGKTAKNRVHLDLGSADLDAETVRVIELGATLVARRQEYGISWATFADPEGNEFCIGLHPHPPGG